MKAEPQQRQHQWLQELVGEWLVEGEATLGPDLPPEPMRGAETVRTLGGLWILAEGTSGMPGGGTATTLMTLGYDAQRNRFVGTFIGSMMTQLWVYDGVLDATGRVLTLETEGPNFTAGGATAKFRDRLELHADGHRSLTSYVLSEGEEWVGFMKARYRRAG
jgi:hypothetical protein